MLLSPALIYADPNEDLIVAARRGDIIGFDAALKAGADVNYKNKSGETALLKAVEANRIGLVERLIESDAAVNTADADGYTPLTIASALDHVEIVKLLLKAGADRNAKNKHGRTALMMTAQSSGSVADKQHLKESAKLLIAAKADLNAKDNSGKTALMICVAHENAYVKNHIAMIKLLIGAKADLNVMDNEGYTVLMQAAQEKYGGCPDPEAAMMLLRAGAKWNSKIEGVTVNWACDEKVRKLLKARGVK